MFTCYEAAMTVMKVQVMAHTSPRQFSRNDGPHHMGMALSR